MFHTIHTGVLRLTSNPQCHDQTALNSVLSLRRYNSVMKILFISVTLAVVYLIRYKRIIRVTYDKDRDTFRSEMLIAVSTVCALLVHERIKGAGYLHFLMEVCISFLFEIHSSNEDSCEDLIHPFPRFQYVCVSDGWIGITVLES